MSRIKSPLVLGMTLAVVFSSTAITLPSSEASTPKPGSLCSKLGLTSISSGMKFTCVKSGKKLIWSKGLKAPSQTQAKVSAPAPTPTPTTVPAPTPTPSTAPAMYVAKDQKTLRHLIANEGCANAKNATAEIQVLVSDNWVKVTPVKAGWMVTPNSCPVAQLGSKDSIAWQDIYLDPGMTYRWYFTGEVNIEHHDGSGHGISQSQTLPLPLPVVTPKKVVGGYGLSWQNIATRVPDISAAAFTDAQATITRNQGQPSAADVFTSYISPGSTDIYSQVENGPDLMKRVFSLFAAFPHAKQVFYIGTTQSENPVTFAKIDALYPSDPFMKQSIDSIYGINTGEPAGSVFTRPTCQGVDSGRNSMDWKHMGSASAVMWSFCPANDIHVHIESDHGAAHEYTHTIQIQMYSGKLADFQPCWMTEGEAEWSQTAVSKSFSEYIGMQHLHPYYLTATGLNYSTPSQTTWTASEIQSYFDTANVLPCNLVPQYALSYSAGAAAIEALVATGGSESFFAVDQRIANGEKFIDAFQEVYGVSWDYAEPILADVVAQKLTHVNAPDASTYQTQPKP